MEEKPDYWHEMQKDAAPDKDELIAEAYEEIEHQRQEIERLRIAIWVLHWYLILSRR